jgi:hypothetical protein
MVALVHGTRSRTRADCRISIALVCHSRFNHSDVQPALRATRKLTEAKPTFYEQVSEVKHPADGTFAHCSCQPSLDAHFPVPISQV